MKILQVGDKVKIVDGYQTSDGGYHNKFVGETGVVGFVDLENKQGAYSSPYKVGDYWYPRESLKLLKKEAQYQVVYKIVKVEDMEFVSAFEENLKLKYDICKKTKALKDKPIFAFGDARTATNTRNECEWWSDWKTEPKNIYETLKCIGKIYEGLPDIDMIFPAGTVFCDWVIPFEVVMELTSK